MRPLTMPPLRPRLLALRLGLLTVLACAPAPETELVPRSTLFVGVDVSGSFQSGGRYDDAMAFAARYIHGHLHGHGGLERPRALFVGSIGGETPGEPQAFHPIHDFRGKSVEEIEADLREWFPPDDRFTDFNAFFERAATLVKRQNLALAPITLVLLSDGVPDLGFGDVEADEVARYRSIDMDPLEYLARNVTVRLLYPDPAVAVHWERDVPRDRVRMWTVDAVVMDGWRDQLAQERPAEMRIREPLRAGVSVGGTSTAADSTDAAGRATPAPAEVASTPNLRDAPDSTGVGPAADTAAPRMALEQPELWRWIRDNVDFRVRRSVF